MKKNVFNFLMLTFGLTLMINLFSCSKDDENSTNSLIGVWEMYDLQSPDDENIDINEEFPFFIVEKDICFFSETTTGLGYKGKMRYTFDPKTNIFKVLSFIENDGTEYEFDDNDNDEIIILKLTYNELWLRLVEDDGPHGTYTENRKYKRVK